MAAPETVPRAVDYAFECGARLGLSSASLSTAAVYIHKFAQEVPDMQIEPDFNLVALACLSLAAKTQEEGRKMRDIANVAHAVSHKDDPVLPMESVAAAKTAIIDHELLVLRALGYQLNVDQPARFIMQFCRSLAHKSQSSSTRRALYAVVHVALAFLNDVLRTTLCIEAEPEMIAAACFCAAMPLVDDSERAFSLDMSEWEPILGINMAEAVQLSTQVIRQSAQTVNSM